MGQPLPNPVIFVPGIMGSSLRDEYPVASEVVWSSLKLVLKEMLDGAWRYRTRLEKLRLEETKDWLAIIGVDARTRVGMRIVKDAAVHARFELSDGDLRNEWASAQPGLRLLTGDNNNHERDQTPILPPPCNV